MSSKAPNDLFSDALCRLLWLFTVGNCNELLLFLRVGNSSPSDLSMGVVKLGVVNTDEDESALLIFTGGWIIISGDSLRLICECRELVSWSVKFFIVLMVSYLLGWSET